jgi:hypothetical protein
MKIALLSVAAIAATSSALFLRQGGFGGGHGDFDMAIFILGFPWDLVPWPEFLTIKHDSVRFIALPCAMNVLSVLVLTFVIRSLRRKRALRTSDDVQ